MSKTKILVVEDEGIVAADIEESLKNLGYEVTATVSSGAEAIEEIERQKPDLVLMDIVLQGRMNGIDTAGTIRTRFSVPVVYLTAYADPETLERAKITQPFGYLIKPFEDRELHSVIEMGLYKHQIEKKLRDSEEWLLTTLKSIGDAVIATDSKGHVKFMNHVAQSLTGWKEEAIGISLRDIFHIVNEDTGNEVESPVEKVLREGVIVGLANHTELIAKDGTRTPIDDSGAPIRDSSGNVIGVVLVFRDISERRRAEKTLAQEKQRLAVTLRSIGDGVITTNIEGKIILINKVAEELTGWTQEEASGKPLATVFYIINEQTRELCENPVEKVLKSGGIIGLANHTALISKNGTQRTIADSGAPIRDQDGNIFGVVLVFRDITEKAKLEEELIKAKKLESVGLLAGGIAHDFNNLLTSILCNISLSKMYSTEEDEIFGSLDDAEKATLNAKDLTFQLLTFAKGGAPIIRPASISELIEGSADFILRGSNVRCDVSFPDGIWTVKVDEGQINQVLNNLVINADQAMPDGGIIKVGAKNITIGEKDALPLKSGDYVVISIKDQGVGISDEHLQKIFDPYFSTKQKGSGLGLATSYSIIKRHHGHITVKSEITRGSTFEIFLPASKKEIAAKKVEEKIIVVGKGKILLMDDQEIIRNTVGISLKRIGYDVAVANDGQAAIDLYKKAKESENPFDAIIMDLTVPGGLGGKEAVKKLLQFDPDVKAIVSSGYSHDPVMANFKEFGFHGFVTKPYKVRELNDVLCNVIKKESKKT